MTDSQLIMQANILNCDLDELSVGSFEEERCEQEEDRLKIERWTRIYEDGFEMINGVKYTVGGTIIYSDDDECEETASEIAAKTQGELLREEARQRIQDNPEAYKNLPIKYGERENEEEDYFDWSAPDATEKWNAQMEENREIIQKERDIYLANGGLTNQEFSYLHRHLPKRENVLAEEKKAKDYERRYVKDMSAKYGLDWWWRVVDTKDDSEIAKKYRDWASEQLRRRFDEYPSDDEYGYNYCDDEYYPY
jgi:hypothetical protein